MPSSSSFDENESLISDRASESARMIVDQQDNNRKLNELRVLGLLLSSREEIGAALQIKA